MMAPAPAQMPSMAATIGCGHARIVFTRSPVMRVNARISSVRPEFLNSTSGPMISCTQPPERVAQLVVHLEGQRILPLRTVERDRRDLVGQRPSEGAGRDVLRVDLDHAVSPPSTP